jgi:hypothetical protein
MPAEWLVVRLVAPADRFSVPEVRLHVERDGECQGALGRMTFTGMADVTRL